MTPTTPSPVIDDATRAAILSKPAAVLDDSDLMRALVQATEAARGDNVVDLRGLAMDRLEARLDRLESTHQTVIAAAYDNLAGTNQIHRAILALLEPVTFELFLRELDGAVADILRVDAVKLVLETAGTDTPPTLARLNGVLQTVRPGFVAHYLTAGRGPAPRAVTLRPLTAEAESLYGDAVDMVQSEACLRLDLGADRLPGMLVLAAQDGQMFGPQQGTDLLAFFAGVFERTLRRWLS